MSTTHPTNITTEWDDLQRKYGNLPKLEEQETNEVRDAKLVEVSELELLREARLRAWKKSMEAKVRPTFGVPVPITEENFVDEVTNASKGLGNENQGDGEGPESGSTEGVKGVGHRPVDAAPELLKTAGQFIPVLLLDDKKESIYLQDAWRVLARRHPNIKFGMAPANKILRTGGKSRMAPSSVLLYYGGKCIMQKSAYSALQMMTYEISGNSIEDRVADALETILNCASSHGPFLCDSKKSSVSSSDSDTSDDEGGHALRSAGKAFQRNFLSKLTGGKVKRDSDSESDREGNSKTYTSWVLDRALR